MQLTIEQIFGAVAGLSMLEDPEIKLSGDTVLAMAINLNKLRPISDGYTKARARMLSDALTEGQASKKTNQEIEAEFVEKDAELRAKFEDVAVRKIHLKDLNLGSNPKLRPGTVEKLLPILDGVE